VSQPDNLFVYGTLRRNAPNRYAALLARSGHLLGEGTVSGRLHRIADYSGLVLTDRSGDRIRGDVYRLDDPEAIYRELDTYEGCAPNDPLPHEFRRTTVAVLLDSGEPIHASAYVYVPIPEK
jgi:gamma-glutamylcyclotransferase (GGCT)/AIG2-like uncharacterized protein YtfP